MVPRQMMVNRTFQVFTKRGVVRYNPQGRNPIDWSKPVHVPKERPHYGATWGATMFVGLSVSKVPTWTAEQIREAVREVRDHQMEQMLAAKGYEGKALEQAKKSTEHGGSVVPQLGYWCRVDEVGCEEDSVSVSIRNLSGLEDVDVDAKGHAEGSFVDNMWDLGVVLALKFQQESVIIQIDRYGVVVDVMDVRPQEGEG